LNPHPVPPNYNYSNINNNTEINEEFLNWLHQQQLIRIHNVQCSNCPCILRLQRDNSKKNDHFILRCTDCNKKLSIRHDSFFDHHHLKITTIIRIIHLLRQKAPMKFIQDETGATQPTIHSIYIAIGEKVSRFMHQNKPIFDPTDVIECDETVEDWAFDTIPTYATNIVTRTGRWVFGMRARHSNKVWLEPIEGRSIYDLIPIIRPLIPDTATILTDALLAYNRLIQYPYIYLVINKAREGFARFDEGFQINVHVNTMEATWGKFREYLHRHHDQHRHHVFYACNYYMYDLIHDSYVKLIKL
jgi:hypothetical protein